MISGIDPSKRQEQQQGTSKKKCLFLEKMSAALIKHILSFVEAPTDRGNAATCKALNVIVQDLTKKGTEQNTQITTRFKHLFPLVESEISKSLKKTIRFIALNIIPNLTPNSPVVFHYPMLEGCTTFVTAGKKYWILFRSSDLEKCHGYFYSIIFDSDANWLSGFSARLNYHTDYGINFINTMLEGQYCLPATYRLYGKGEVLVVQQRFTATFQHLNRTRNWTLEPLPIFEKLKMVASILKAVSFLHEWDIVHGNLSEEAIAYSEGTFYLTNFMDIHIKENGKLDQKIKEFCKSQGIEPKFDRSKRILKNLDKLFLKPIDVVKAYHAAQTYTEQEDALKMLDDSQNDIWHLGILLCQVFFNGVPFWKKTFQEMFEWGESATYPFNQNPDPPHPNAFIVPLIVSMLAQDPKLRPTIKQVIDIFLDVIHKKLGKKFYTLEHFLVEPPSDPS